MTTGPDRGGGTSTPYGEPEKAAVEPEASTPKPLIHELPPEELTAGVRKVLRRIWDSTRRSSDMGLPFDAWYAVVTRAVDERDLVLERELREALAGAGTSAEAEQLFEDVNFTGDAPTVELMVGATVDTVANTQQAVALIAGPVARAVARLEAEGTASRENICDIVIRALTPMRASLVAATLSEDAARYLLDQPADDRGVGYYVTLTSLASNVIAPLPREEARSLVGALLYHLSLRALWRAANMRVLDVNERVVRSTLLTGAGNQAIVLAEWRSSAQTDDGALAERAVRSIRQLKHVTAAVAPASLLSPERAAALLETVGLPTEDPVELATVVNDAAIPANSWGDGTIEAGHLQAASAAFAPGAGLAEQVAARLYNAALVLDRAGRDESHIVGQLVLNGLGLEWALRLTSSLGEALLEGDGLDCIVNFTATVVQFRDAGHDIHNLVRPTQLMAAASLAIGTPWSDARVARVARSADRLSLDDTVPVDAGALAMELAGAIESLLTPRVARQASIAREDGELRTALAVRDVFMPFVPDDETGEWSAGLLAILHDLVAARRSPREAFLSAYEPFAEPLDSDLGTSPLVAAGMVDADELERLGRDLLAPLSSLAPSLRRLWESRHQP